MEFTTNNTYFINISCILFLANSKQYFGLSFEPILALKNTTAKKKHKLIDIDKFANKIENIYQELQNNMFLAQVEQNHYANIS